MSYYKTLKELANQYTNDQIILEAAKVYGLHIEDIHSLCSLLDQIRESPMSQSDKKIIEVFFTFLHTDDATSFVFYAGYIQNRRKYRLTRANTRNIDEIAAYKVHLYTEEEAAFIESFPNNELRQLAVVLISLNTFSAETINKHFEGDAASADTLSYIVDLIDWRKEVDSMFSELDPDE